MRQRRRSVRRRIFSRKGVHKSYFGLISRGPREEGTIKTWAWPRVVSAPSDRLIFKHYSIHLSAYVCDPILSFLKGNHRGAEASQSFTESFCRFAGIVPLQHLDARLIFHAEALRPRRGSGS